MKKTFYLFLTALFAAFLTPHVSARPELDIAGQLSGTFTFSPTNIAPGDFTTEFRVSGFVTNVGPVDAIIIGQVRLAANGTVTPIPQGSFTVTTESGDQIFGTIRWRGELIDLSRALYSVSGEYTVTGGTGAFKNARGEGSATGGLSALGGRLTFTLTGTVSSPKKEKKEK